MYALFTFKIIISFGFVTRYSFLLKENELTKWSTVLYKVRKLIIQKINIVCKQFVLGYKFCETIRQSTFTELQHFVQFVMIRLSVNCPLSGSNTKIQAYRVDKREAQFQTVHCLFLCL